MLRCTAACLQNVLVVESPNKVATLRTFLSKAPGKWGVVATIGHVNETESFDPVEMVGIEGLKSDRGRVLASIIDQYQKGPKGLVYLATDPDREGEVIASDVESHLLRNNVPQDDIVRVSFNEITSTAVLDAIATPGTINENLVSAGRARSLIDFWFGYSASRLLWELGRNTDGALLCPSAGRVQSPALSLVADRVAQRDSHKKATYYTPRVAIGTQGRKTVAANLRVKGMSRLSMEEAQEVHDIVKASPKFKVKTGLSEVQKPPPPFLDTAACLKEASKHCRLSVQAVQTALQGLFDEGYITYLRTDSTAISSEAAEAIAKHVSTEYGPEYVFKSKAAVSQQQKEPKKKAKKGVATQEAHEAIRPTNISRSYNKPGSNERQKVYAFIQRRTLEAAMPKPRHAQIKYTLTCESTFRGKEIAADFVEKELLFKGSDALAETKDAASEPVDLFYEKSRRMIEVRPMETEKRTTTPPPLLDQADLIEEMKKKGIGRPSTYNSIITKIVQRGYAADSTKGLTMATGGVAAHAYMQENFPEWVDYAYTANMEKSLDEIAQGKLDKVTFLKGFRTAFSAALQKADKKPSKTFVGTDEETGLNIWLRDRQAKKYYQLSELGRVHRIFTNKKFPSPPTYQDFLKKGKVVDTLQEAKEARMKYHAHMAKEKKEKKEKEKKASSA
eukprot:Rhum_TRINITY_DN10528_c0_g1::Rhum_TRINITY_DN10528_c0_g1_i1::g.38910::m.38910/K03168/topA; DNA topoisomerase I